jgi:quercetin dioxygenase-like cupin family protein
MSTAGAPGELFPEFIRALPMVDSPLRSLRGWMLRTDQALAMFYEIPDGVELPEHAHGAQWGVVLAGAIDFTIGGVTRTYRTGDTYFVPAGAPHSAVIHPGFAGIDVFADADRYRPREEAEEPDR